MTDELTEFNATLTSAYEHHWLRSDTDQRVGMMQSLCLAVAASIAFMSECDRKIADTALLIAETHIRNSVEDFINIQNKKRAH